MGNAGGQRYKFVGGLIASYIRDENNKLYKVTFAKPWFQSFWRSNYFCWLKPLLTHSDNNA
jgi:hypothetical protein